MHSCPKHTRATLLPSPPNQRYKLNIWDVGGQRTLRPYWRNYFEKTDGLVWVVDAADAARLQDCRAELAALLKEERLVGATLLVLANKQDLPSALTQHELEEALGLRDLGKRRWRVVAASARTGEGLLEGFGWLVKDIASRIYLFSE
jgi:ADP-ribosylation factor-like protein 2